MTGYAERRQAGDAGLAGLSTRPRPLSSTRRGAFYIVALLTVSIGLCAALAPAALADPLDDAVAGLSDAAPYTAARETMLAAGWKLAAFDATTIGGRCSFREEVCMTYPETESCSGTGMGFCVFRFEAGDGRRLSITTGGEELDDLVVYGWSLD